MAFRHLVQSFRLPACLLAAAIFANMARGYCADDAIERLIAHGCAEEANKHYAMALKYYVSALARDRYNVRIILLESRAELELGDLDKAIMHARLATQVDPKDVPAHLQLGQTLEANRDAKSAELQYERALDLKIGGAEAIQTRNKIVHLLMDLDDLERADRLTLEWVKKHSKDADCHFDRGLILSLSVKPKNQSEALKEFKKCLALDPELSKAHYQMALLLIKQDDAPAAKSELQNFIDSHPSQAELEEAKAKLAKLK